MCLSIISRWYEIIIKKNNICIYIPRPITTTFGTCLVYLHIHNHFPVCCMSSSALVFTLILKITSLVIPITLPCLNWWAQMHKPNTQAEDNSLSWFSYCFSQKDNIAFQRQHAITVKHYFTVQSKGQPQSFFDRELPSDREWCYSFLNSRNHGLSPFSTHIR